MTFPPLYPLFNLPHPIVKVRSFLISNEMEKKKKNPHILMSSQAQEYKLALLNEFFQYLNIA